MKTELIGIDGVAKIRNCHTSTARKEVRDKILPEPIEKKTSKSTEKRLWIKSEVEAAALKISTELKEEKERNTPDRNTTKKYMMDKEFKPSANYDLVNDVFNRTARN